MTNTEICSFKTNYKELNSYVKGRILKLISPKGNHVADLKIVNIKTEKIQQFGDYLKNGY